MCRGPSYPAHERIIAVRVEAPRAVDDIVLTFSDGHIVYVNAKERVRIKSPEWKHVWEQLQSQYESAEFVHGRDRLLLHFGTVSEQDYALLDLCQRARTSVDAVEWSNRRTGIQSELLVNIRSAVSDKLAGDDGRMRSFLSHVDVALWPLRFIEQASEMSFIPPSNRNARTLFRLLRDRVGGTGRVRGTFDLDGLLHSLSKDDGVSIGESIARSSPLMIDHEPAAHRIELGRMPDTGGLFIGRSQVLAELHRAWSDPSIRVITYVAPGGLGKTSLVNRWLAFLNDQDLEGTRAFAWSFYRQGTDGGTDSGNEFLNEALRFFSVHASEAFSSWDRAQLLVRAIRAQRTLLILDGLEPLQHPPGPRGGYLKDPVMAGILKELAASMDGLCVITTRYPLADIAVRRDASAPVVDLPDLDPTTGRELLTSLGVWGRPKWLEDAAREFGGNPLALTLLGTFLRDTCRGDVRSRDRVAALDPTALMEEDSERTGHAERVMASYETWFGPGPEITLLALLSLFDRPAEPFVLRVLTSDPAAGRLSRDLPEFETRAWTRVVARLREARLLSPALPDDASLDTHPLIRAYFARKLRSQDAEGWRTGHTTIYEHLKEVAPESPDTLHDMMPLFHAVIHGCRAGMYYDAFHEVYQRRILHGDEHFSWKQLGTMSLDLAVLAGFFEGGWDNPVDSLSEADTSEIQSQVGIYLRALGRLDEAVSPMRDSILPAVQAGDWLNAAQRAANYSELQLVRGALAEALRWAEQSVEFADRTNNGFRQLSFRARVGDALHQIGRIDESLGMFAEAERRQQIRQPQYPVMYSFHGYLYHDLLLGRIEDRFFPPLRQATTDDVVDECERIRERAEQVLEWTTQKERTPPLSLACARLVLGRSWTATGVIRAQRGEASDEFSRAEFFLTQALSDFRQAETLHELPRGLLARAALRRLLSDFDSAEEDLKEALEIATFGSMTLHTCDVQHELARLCISSGRMDAAQHHLQAAEKIARTIGSFRRVAVIESTQLALG